MTTLYGIKNCDTIKKARKHLETRGIDYRFHDYRIDGLSPEWLAEVADTVGWEILLNKRGTTFRQLSDEQKNNLDKHRALALMTEFPAMIKRPVLEHQGSVTVGYKAADYDELPA